MGVIGRVARFEDDEDAFAQRNRDWLYRLALRISGDRDLAADLTQESLVRAFRSRHKRQELGSEQAWLRTILVRRYLTHRESQRPSQLREETASNPSFEEDLAVRQTLARLTTEQRTVLGLSIGEGLTYLEIAESLGVPVGTGGSKLHTARAAFRKLWEETR